MPASRERIAPLLRLFEPDVAVCIGFPWKIPPDALAAPRHGIVNGHPSLLPRYRGPSPVSWAIRNGESEIGFTFHYMDAELDTGNILGQVPIPLGDEHGWEELTPKLAEAVGEHAAGRPRAGRARRSRRSAGRERGELLPPLRARVRVDRPVTIDGRGRAAGSRVALPLRQFAGDRGALTELDGETVRVLRVSREPADGPALDVRRRHTLDRGDGGAVRPVIGITSYAQEARWGVWHMPAALVPLAYVDSIERAGGRAIVIPPAEEDVEETLDALDGIVFSGGADVDPARYGAEAHPETDTPQTRRDAGEMALLQAALERDMPTLAICRGFQLLNVARGGDLIQHLPEAIGNDEHKQVPGEFAVHPVEVKDGSRLASIVGAGSDVTSHHHQGLGRVGDGLVETAWAADGTLEAVEDPSLRFARRRAVASGGRRGRSALRGARRAGSRVPRFAHAVGSPPAHVDQEERVYFAFFDHLRRAVRRLHRGRAAAAGDGALGRREGALDPRAARRPRLRVGRLRDLADAADRGLARV